LVVRRLFELLVLCCRSSGSKELEILVLRHELSILRRQPRRSQLREADRLFLAALSRALPRRAWSAFSVSPRTLLRWLWVPETEIRLIRVRKQSRGSADLALTQLPRSIARAAAAATRRRQHDAI
jgi:hypothetical protein